MVKTKLPQKQEYKKAQTYQVWAFQLLTNLTNQLN